MKSIKILFYYPSNKRTIALETLLIELRRKGNEVLILTTCGKGDFHFYMESIGFETFTNEVQTRGIGYYLKQIIHLVKFCNEKRINVVHSHLQHVNVIAVISQYFVKSKIIVFRHHFRFVDGNEEMLNVNKNEILFDKIINRFALKIIVPSIGVFEGIKKHEKVNMNKIHIIPYIYDFSKYQTPSIEETEEIKLRYPCKLRLIMVSRLINLKRHLLVFHVIKELIDLGFDIKLLVLDEGPEKQNLESYISKNNLSDKIIMLGFRTDFVNFMAASDLLIQPSLTDASNSAAKEMAILGKTIAVSKNVGDYSEYVKEDINGYLIPTQDSSVYLKNIIIDAYNNSQKIILMGQILKKEIILKFGVLNAVEIVTMYEKLL